MKKATLLAVFMMAPLLAPAQSRWSVAPTIGFYKAELDKLNDLLNEMEELGVNVQKPNGGLQFGGRLDYEKSQRFS